MSDKIDKLDRATLLVNTRGWTTGTLETGPKGPVCLNGALYRAINPSAQINPDTVYTNPEVNRLAAEVVKTYEAENGPLPARHNNASKVVHLNDSIARNAGGKSFILGLLRKTILRLKNEGSL